MTTPRILELCTVFGPGGMQRHVLDLSTGLRAEGWHVAMAGTPGAWLNETIDRDFFPLWLTEVSDRGGSLPRRLVATASSTVRLRKILKEQRIDLIHAHETASALVARLATMGRRTPIAFTFHGAQASRIPQIQWIAKHCADLVITPSETSADDLARDGGPRRDSIKVIGLGTAPPPATDPADIAALRRELLGDGELLVVAVARVTFQKGIDHLVEVAARLRAGHPGLRFAVVGEGPLMTEAQGWIQAAQLGDVVRLVGYSDTPWRYLAAADLFLLTSRWESSPIAIIEAFFAGLPVVATDTGGVRELVDSSVGAVLPVGDIEGLACEVAAIASDAGRRATLSMNAKARSREARFDPSVMVSRMSAVYQGMIASHRRKTSRP